jgi:tRNA modification GTPase
VIRLEGPGSLDLAHRLFEPKRPPRLAHGPTGVPRLGSFGLHPHARDQVVALPLGGDRVEIYPHGGLLTVQLVLDALAAQGAKILSPEAFLQATRTPLSAIAAEIDLARAPTARSAAILHDQAQGALHAELLQILDLCQIGDLPLASRRLDLLIARAAWGTRLLSGWNIVLFGRPNVGKSRLLNALLGFERAIVTPLPGTTRDAVSASTAIAGWPVVLVDTAGQREAQDPLEQLGIARAQAQLQHADLALLVLDRSSPIHPRDLDLIQENRLPTLRVASKADLPPAWDHAEFQAHAVSSTTGRGLAELISAITRTLFPQEHAPGDPVPWKTDQRDQLQKARAALEQGRIPAAILSIQALIAPPPLTGP